MTNGEKLKEVFPKGVHIGSGTWMSMEYEEPTGIDCIDRNSIKYYSGQGGYMYASKGEIDKLPSVTPQEPVLDKIRAEIRDIKVIHDEYSQRQNDYCDGVEFAKRYVLQIIDKYKAETENI